MTAPDDPSGMLDAALRRGLARTGIPGAVAFTARHGRRVGSAVQGWAMTHDQGGPLAEPVPMRPDTRFDVASLTKVIATTAVAMTLVDRGRLDPVTPASRFLPAFTGHGKDEVTVAQLLEHRAGLAAWYPLFLHTADPAEAVALACRLPLARPPGNRRVYSDLGMLLLGAVAEQLADERLDVAAQRLVFSPLGMTATGFRPQDRRGIAATSTGNPVERRLVAGMSALDGGRCATAAPRAADLEGGRATHGFVEEPAPAERREPWRAHTLVGEVNDANAAQAMGGVAGHAGVFSSAPDLARFAQALLDGGTLDGERVWASETVDRFLRPGRDPEQALGFWLRRVSQALGTAVPGDDSVGHRGFTGCEIAASPTGGWVAVLLTNRLHTDADPPPDHAIIWQRVLRQVAGTA